jgi:5'-nucleotidase
LTLSILVTNDDGINAPGLKVAEEIAIAIAGETGEVITVAPAVDQSGVGHSISYLRPSLIHQCSNSRFSVEGTPADCVLAGIYHVMKDRPPNLIISGVNNGHNLSDDVVYSGTVGAAMEGALQGIKSIAISQCYSTETLLFDDIFETAREFGAQVCDKVLTAGDWNQNPYQIFYNINFPAAKVFDIKGLKVCKQGKRPKGSFRVDPIQALNSRTFLMVNHKPGTQTTGKQGVFRNDSEVIKDNYITVTPLKADLTSYDELPKLKDIIDNDF